MRSTDDAPSTRTTSRSLFREVLAVLLLTLGSILPVIPWLVGVALLWTSDRWRVGEKLLGTLVWPFGYWAVLSALTFAGGECVSGSVTDENGRTLSTSQCSGVMATPWLGVVIMVVLVVAPLVVGGVLVIRASRRARAERAALLAA